MKLKSNLTWLKTSLAAIIFLFSGLLAAIEPIQPASGELVKYTINNSKVQAELNSSMKVNASEKQRVIISLNRNIAARGLTRRQEVSSLQDSVLQAFSHENNGKGLRVLRRYSHISGFSAELNAAQIAALSNRDEVSFIEIMPMHYKNSPESFPLTDVDLAHADGFTGNGTVIVLVDDGIDYGHAAFGGVASFPNAKVIAGYDFADFDSDPGIDCAAQSHGTATAGVAAGNGGGVIGTAPDASIIMLKIQSASLCGSGSLDGDVIGAMDWIVDNKNTYGIDVVSMSFGGGSYTSVSSCDGSSSAYFNAVKAVADAGVTVLVASGNDGLCDAISRPACFSDAISVGAVYDADDPANTGGQYGWCVSNSSCANPSFNPGCPAGTGAIFEDAISDNVIVYSNSASFLDIVGPSTCALTAQASGGTNSCFGGTSSSTPFVAGVAALVIDKEGSGVLSNEDMRARLSSTGDSVTDPKNGRISPRVNGLSAVNDGGGPPPPPGQVLLTSDGFESGLGNWSNASGIDSHDWTRDSGGTPSSSTGPSSGSGGSSWYMYLETSSAGGGAFNAGDTAILNSASVIATDVRLKFDYHMYGSNMGTLDIDIFSGGTWTNSVWSISGQQHTSNGSAYTTADIDLSAFVVEQIRFRATAAGSWRGDMAIDNVEVWGVPGEEPPSQVISSSDFESGLGDWTNPSVDDDYDWTRDSGGTPSNSTGPSQGAGGSSFYMYMETSNGSGAYVAGDTAFLESIDLLGSNRTLTFDYHMYGSNIGTLSVDIFSGGSWINDIWSISGQQHTSNGANYTSASVDLTSFTGTIKLRFRATAAGSWRGDIAIDNLVVTEEI